mmetsp:Transcript_77891/g.215266  ORF Transcript_77891/g.215266 Transcript_77891/m.215266 type:complete len:290 (-) Transcript_77891:80-949(-)
MVLKVSSSFGNLPVHLSLRDGADKLDKEWERDFEVADIAEKGLAREVATEFLQPLRRSRKLWRFRVVQSEDRQQFRLTDDSGQFLMHARMLTQARRVEFFLYDPQRGDALYDSSRPAFTMSHDSDASDWLLVQEHCEHCQFSSRHRSCACLGKQQVAQIMHSRKSMGDRECNCLDVCIPGIYSDGGRVVWCPLSGRGDLADADDGSLQVQRLTTKSPVWNEEVQSLVLDFKGRTVRPSAKNFQLTLTQQPEQVICQFGRLGTSTFGLDFRYPLSVIQAFALSITTFFWA